MNTLILEENNTSILQNALTTDMNKAIAHLEKEMTAVRTGRAHTSLVDTLQVECYGSFMQLKELASVAAPDTNMITIQPWDKTVISAIEKAIMSSHLGLTPQTDGDLIRIELPRMTTERREELTKVVGKKVEETKVQIRNVRKDYLNVIRDNEKSKHISEDFAKRLTKALQDNTDTYVAKADEIGNKKRSDLMNF